MRTLTIRLALIFLSCLPAAGAQVPNPMIEEVTRPIIGGLPQRVIVRGQVSRSPLIIIVHGGPGTDEGPLFRRYTAALEHDHAVVYWEQRGTGRSYSSHIDPLTMTIDRFVSDLAEVVDYADRRYSPGRPVMLISHSWGSIPAMRFAAAYPSKVYAHIVVSPILDAPRAERASWSWALDTAKRRNDGNAVLDLMQAGPPPQSVKSMLTTRHWVERFGGTFHGRMRTRDLVVTGIRDRYLNLYDVVRFGRGNAFSLKYLWPEIRQTQWPIVRPLGVPSLFVLGQYDEVTPTQVNLAVAAKLSAPCKRIEIFKHSAHNPPFEEPGHFMALISEIPNWLAKCQG